MLVNESVMVVLLYSWIVSCQEFEKGASVVLQSLSKEDRIIYQVAEEAGQAGDP